MPALSPSRTIILHRACLVRGLPLSETNNGWVLLGDPDLAREARSFLVHSIAVIPSGTARSLPPFPNTVRNPSSKLILPGVRPASSDTRSPVAYRISSIALSLRPLVVDGSGVDSNRSTSYGARNLGSDCNDFGDSMLTLGSTFRKPS